MWGGLVLLVLIVGAIVVVDLVKTASFKKTCDGCIKAGKCSPIIYEYNPVGLPEIEENATIQIRAGGQENITRGSSSYN